MFYLSFRPCKMVTLRAVGKLEDVCESMECCKGLAINNRIPGLQIIVEGKARELLVPVVGVFVLGKGTNLKALATLTRSHFSTHLGAELIVEKDARTAIARVPWGETMLQLITTASQVRSI